MKKVYIGIIHDTYTDENGKEVAYSEVIAGTWKGKTFKAVSIPYHMFFENAEGRISF